MNVILSKVTASLAGARAGALAASGGAARGGGWPSRELSRARLAGARPALARGASPSRAGLKPGAARGRGAPS